MAGLRVRGRDTLILVSPPYFRASNVVDTKATKAILPVSYSTRV
jgi:hypothetical protein